MQSRSAFSRMSFGLAVVILGAIAAMPAITFGGLTVIPDEVAASAPGAAAGDANTLEARQYHIENARLPGAGVRQTVTAWQVTQGTWNGQSLDGLSLVLVQAAGESASSPGQTTCYLSHDATPAQREALLAAFLASQPQLLMPHEAESMRIEPAVISVDVDGQTVTLHLGLIA